MNFAFREYCNRRDCRAPKPVLTTNLEDAKKMDWRCEGCGNKNFAFRDYCNRRECGKPRPRSGPTGGDWECRYCGNTNFGYREVCNRHSCRRPRDNHMGAMDRRGPMMDYDLSRMPMQPIRDMAPPHQVAMNMDRRMGEPNLRMGDGIGMGMGPGPNSMDMARGRMGAEFSAIPRFSLGGAEDPMARGAGVGSLSVPRSQGTMMGGNIAAAAAAAAGTDMSSVKLYQDRVDQWIAENSQRAVKDWPMLKRLEEDLASAVTTAITKSYPSAIREGLLQLLDSVRDHLKASESPSTAVVKDRGITSQGYGAASSTLPAQGYQSQAQGYQPQAQPRTELPESQSQYSRYGSSMASEDQYRGLNSRTQTGTATSTLRYKEEEMATRPSPSQESANFYSSTSQSRESGSYYGSTSQSRESTDYYDSRSGTAPVARVAHQSTLPTAKYIGAATTTNYQSQYGGQQQRY